MPVCCVECSGWTSGQGFAQGPLSLTLSPAASSFGTFCCDTCTEISCWWPGPCLMQVPGKCWHQRCAVLNQQSTKGAGLQLCFLTGTGHPFLLGPRRSPAGWARLHRAGMVTVHDTTQYRGELIFPDNSHWCKAMFFGVRGGWVPVQLQVLIQLLRGLAVWCRCTQHWGLQCSGVCRCLCATETKGIWGDQ